MRRELSCSCVTAVAAPTTADDVVAVDDNDDDRLDSTQLNSTRLTCIFKREKLLFKQIDQQENKQENTREQQEKYFSCLKTREIFLLFKNKRTCLFVTDSLHKRMNSNEIQKMLTN